MGDYGTARPAAVCRALGGRTLRDAAGDEIVCVGADLQGTFCVLDATDAFPCRGLFRHALRCRLEFDRPALNPFLCGPVDDE